MDSGALDKIFSVATAAWAALCLNAVALFKAWPSIMGRLNERQRDIVFERERDWERIRSERDVAREERDLVRDRWAECERISHERLGRAVIAEATLISRDREAGRVTILPEDMKPNGGDDG